MAVGDCRIGMVGLGVMGRNLLLNMAEHGFDVAGYDKDPQKVALLCQEAANLPVQAAGDIASFIALLRAPRAVMLLVPAGPVVDSVIRDLLPNLSPGDLVIDAGNSHFTDTDLRQKTLEAKGINFFGMGVSGGEAGARHGPSMMPGGPEPAYQRMRDVLEATAAHVDGDPCVAYLGPGSAGHYVKMVHNGIEYGLMQLIAETYDLLKRGYGLSDDELSEVFSQWNRAELNGYLVEITADIFRTVDELTGSLAPACGPRKTPWPCTSPPPPSIPPWPCATCQAGKTYASPSARCMASQSSQTGGIRARSSNTPAGHYTLR